MQSEHPNPLRVRTTLPVLPIASGVPIRTPRLIMRPLTQDDLPAYHSMRTQIECMHFTQVGRIDRDLAETQEKLNLYLPPNNAQKYNFAVCLAATGEFVAAAGVHAMNPALGWPEVGYMFKQEHWGKGYATEFLKAFLEAWWKLPRQSVELEVDALSVTGAGGESEGVDEVPEQLYAAVDATNSRSLRVMEKAGFRKFKDWLVQDSRVGNEGMACKLVGLVISSQTQRES
ncbi:GNAT domain-containing protein [Xylariales sp. AK1849]|nr:GNAT domain-containing protein [Xylariales sp. AK1849]